jgi:hypothetical protein
MQLFMAVPMKPSAVVSNFGGQRYRRFVPFNFLLSLAAPHLHGVLFHVTSNKFIAGVDVTSDNCLLVSLSPAINLSLVVSFHMELFHIERGFYSRREIGEREMAGKTLYT